MSQHTPAHDKFLIDVKDHKMTIIKDEGLYRHITFRDRPGSSFYRFDLITWPGYLCITGDCETFVFERESDMFEFFYDPSRPFSINPYYWSEKVVSGRSGITEFSEDKFNAAVKADLIAWMRYRRSEISKEDRRELYDEVVEQIINSDGDQSIKYNLISEFVFEYKVVDSGLGGDRKTFQFIDFFEHNTEEFTFHFIWALRAIAYGVHHYYESKKVAAPGIDMNSPFGGPLNPDPTSTFRTSADGDLVDVSAPLYSLDFVPGEAAIVSDHDQFMVDEDEEELSVCVFKIGDDVATRIGVKDIPAGSTGTVVDIDGSIIAVNLDGFSIHRWFYPEELVRRCKQFKSFDMCVNHESGDIVKPLEGLASNSECNQGYMIVDIKDPREVAPQKEWVMTQTIPEPFIDWSKAPEGTTHAYNGIKGAWIDGIPEGVALWEKWTDDAIYDYSDYEGGWNKYRDIADLSPESIAKRVARPDVGDENLKPTKLGLAEMWIDQAETIKQFEDIYLLLNPHAVERPDPGTMRIAIDSLMDKLSVAQAENRKLKNFIKMDAMNHAPKTPAIDMHGRGISLRDYFIAHAPEEPQAWFKPVVSLPYPTDPNITPLCEKDRKDWSEDTMDFDRQRQHRWEARRVWGEELEKQRYIQWPAAWADAMLAAREVQS